MVKQRYLPDRGDITWITFNPQVGHEQTGRRPAIVISPVAYNSKTHLALFCPITSKIKGYPFEVSLPESCDIQGVILADQIKSLDWTKRKAEHVCTVSKDVLEETMNKIRALLQ